MSFVTMKFHRNSYLLQNLYYSNILNIDKEAKNDIKIPILIESLLEIKKKDNFRSALFDPTINLPKLYTPYRKEKKNIDFDAIDLVFSIT
jgi:hypothetical protein